MTGHLIDEVPLPAPLRDLTRSDAWTSAARATWSASTAPPFRWLATVLTVILTVVLASSTGWNLLASFIAALGVVGGALWGSTVAEGLTAIRDARKRRIHDGRAAVTIAEETEAGETTWRLTSHVAYRRRKGHGATFRTLLLKAALPVAYPPGLPPRALIKFGAWHPKVVDLYLAAVAPYGLTVTPDGHSWYGAQQYRIEPTRPATPPPGVHV